MDDKKPTVYTENPFSYNYIALNKTKVDELPTPSATQIITNPLSNAVGKNLGVKNPHEWNQVYDKVHVITEWAKERSGLSDPQELLKWINDKAKTVPSMGNTRINDLYAHIRLGIKKGKDEPNT